MNHIINEKFVGQTLCWRRVDIKREEDLGKAVLVLAVYVNESGLMLVVANEDTGKISQAPVVDFSWLATVGECSKCGAVVEHRLDCPTRGV